MKLGATISIENFSKAIRKAYAPEVARRADKSGKVMVTAVQTVIRNSGINTARPSNRRRYPGSSRLIDAFDYQVEGDATTFPMLISLITAPGTSPQTRARIGYLNDGTGGHRIAARNKTFLKFPPNEPGPPFRYPKSVQHPGHPAGYHFIEKGKTAAVLAAKVAFI